MSIDRLRLQLLLKIDAATCTAMGILLLAASGPIAALTQLPAPLLVGAGAMLLPIAALMAIVSRATPVPRWAVKLVVLGNLAWVLASLALPISGMVRPNMLGWLFLVSQAAVVALLAKLEHDTSKPAVVAR